MSIRQVQVEQIKKIILPPIRKLIVLTLISNSILLIFLESFNDFKSFFSILIGENLIVIPGVLMGFFIASRLKNREAIKITEEVNRALVNCELLKFANVQAGSIFFRLGLVQLRHAILLEGNHNVSVVCFLKEDQAFDAILWQRPRTIFQIFNRERFIAIPIEELK